MDPIAVASGFGIGAIVGITGVGGGSLMTPLLISVFKLQPAFAIGTDHGLPRSRTSALRTATGRSTGTSRRAACRSLPASRRSPDAPPASTRDGRRPSRRRSASPSSQPL
jgi:hypothetical protein